MQLVPTAATASPHPALLARPEPATTRGRILLAYDYPLVRQAIRTLAERDGFEIAAETASGADAVRLSRELAPDVIVLDLEMRFVDGLAVARDLALRHPASGVVVLTARAGRERAIEALWAGIKGYVLKAGDEHHLLHAIRAARAGDRYYSAEAASGIGLSDLGLPHAEKPLLTDREVQVVRLIASGYSTKQVAGELGIRVKTADSHRTKIMEKLRVHETASLVRFAIRHGLLEP